MGVGQGHLGKVRILLAATPALAASVIPPEEFRLCFEQYQPGRSACPDSFALRDIQHHTGLSRTNSLPAEFGISTSELIHQPKGTDLHSCTRRRSPTSTPLHLLSPYLDSLCQHRQSPNPLPSAHAASFASTVRVSPPGELRLTGTHPASALSSASCPHHPSR